MQSGVFLLGAAVGLALDGCLRRWFSAGRTFFSPRRAAWTALAAGGCFLWAQARFAPDAQWRWAAALGVFLLAIARVDWERQYIFDRMLLPLAALGLGLRLFASPWDGGLADWSALALGPLAGGGALGFVALLCPGGMGGGDIKFAAALGLWFGWQDVLLVLYLACVTGGIAGLFLLLTGRKGRRDPVAFGPFIAAAAWLQCLYGAELAAGLRALLS